MMKTSPVGAPVVVWLRQDLRLADNPALRAAAERGGPVVPLYIWSPEDEGEWRLGGASRYWLHQSLRALAAQLEQRGSRLILAEGSALEVLRATVQATGASAVYWNRRYEPAVVARDARIKQALKDEGTEPHSFNGSLLWEPWTVETQQGAPYKVFTPFWKRCQEEPVDPPSAAPDRLPAPAKWPNSVPLDELQLEPKIPWAQGIAEAWTPGEQAAAERLEQFTQTIAPGYEETRNRPDLDGVSRMSPHLHFGEISPRTIWHRLRRAYPDPETSDGRNASSYLREIAWREFAHHLLYHFPETTEQPLRREFEAFPWEPNERQLSRWQRGQTGYPIVDAGMRELWATGWMHNRVRMIVASFLVKDLMIAWQEGARWFWDTLVDADLANNTLGWQWTAGCGADAAPYFRVFNPISQGAKFDPHGDYVRRWIPELAGIDLKHLHSPWEAADPPARYPAPIVDHAQARKAALAAYEVVRSVRG